MLVSAGSRKSAFKKIRGKKNHGKSSLKTILQKIYKDIQVERSYRSPGNILFLIITETS